MKENLKRTEKLYSTLGELIYAVAKADGAIQQEEFARLDELLRGHKWGETIKWSFEYESKKDNDPEQIYQKVINNCQFMGPAPEYLEFIDMITEVADASQGVDEDEERVIRSFSHDLIERFKKDIQALSQSE